MQWSPILPDGSIREALANELLMYDLAWENLELFGGHLEIIDENSNSITVENIGWGAAYNVTAGNGIIDIIQPGETVIINKNGNFMQYHRLIQIGEEGNLTLMNVNLTLMNVNLTVIMEGCTDPEAENYDEDAEVDDGSCEYAPPLPVAIAGKEVTVDESEVVQFSGAGTIENGTIVLYEWDFDGDGVFEWSSEDNGITTFIYNEVGKYVATLRVTDNLGATATDNKTIRVVAKTDNIEEDDSGISVPSVSLISSIAAIGIIALRRRY
jgi:PKD repeat protein